MNWQAQSERWQTPPQIFDPLMREFSFDLDAAADPQTARVPRFLSNALDSEEWPGERIWMNPPYGRKLESFVRRAAWEHQRYPNKTIVALIPFRCRASWWHECVIGKAQEVRCVRKRIRFVRLDGTPGRSTGSCDSCLVIWQGKAKRTVLVSWNPAKVY